ncbi:prepilin peptidase [Pseudonocardia phyllosphaerae]|uniref:prepilin peptidase n=1 Tax=Pseudonocardia phyllosphaerae TaxID=3390502 RepID=UPI003979E28E
MTLLTVTPVLFAGWLGAVLLAGGLCAVLLAGGLCAVLLAGGLGVLAGIRTRRWLAGLPRGAVVPPPWCEAALGLLWACTAGLVATGVLDAAAAVPVAVLCWLAVAGSATDLVHRRLPNALTLPALPVVLLALAPAGWDAVARGAAGAALLAGAYAVVHLVSPVSLGAGDVKLALPVGAALGGAGWPVLLAGAVAAAVLAGAVAAGAVLAGRAALGSRLPFGPVLLAAALASVTAAGVLGTGGPAPPL